MTKKDKLPKKNNNKAQRIPFWLQIILILLSGVILSAVVYFIIIGKTANKTEDDGNQSKAIYTVTFAYLDGTVIDKKQAMEGTGTFPPEFKTDGVFQGWSGSFNEVRGDTEVHPLVYDIVDDENLFCFDSVYVKEGDQFTIDLRLEGNINITNAELSMEYDENTMDYVGSLDANNCTVTKEKDGRLIIKLNNENPLTEECLLSSISFLSLQRDVYSTQIDLNYIKGTLLIDGKEVPATVTTLNNQIYYLQEVFQ